MVAHNAASWCEQALRSVFEQDYERYRVVFVDDASVDGTLEKAQQFIVNNKQDYRVIAIRNESPLGPVGSLYRAAEHCQDSGNPHSAGWPRTVHSRWCPFEAEQNISKS